MWLYPIKGVKGFKVDYLEVTPHGVKNDRIWAIVDLKTGEPVTGKHSELISFLRVVRSKDDPNEFKICL
jgi:uncharacterized protein YcbX